MPQARDLADLIVRSLEMLGGKAHRHDVTRKAIEIGAFTRAQLAEPTHAIAKRRTYPTELHYRMSLAITHARNAGLIERVERNVWRLTQRSS